MVGSISRFLGNVMQKAELSGAFLGRNIVSIHDFSKAEIEFILNYATQFISIAKGENYSTSLNGKLLATLFFEPSTRTRLSFESAMKRLGGQVIGITER